MYSINSALLSAGFLLLSAAPSPGETSSVRAAVHGLIRAALQGQANANRSAPLNACDLNGDGTVDSSDVQLVTNMSLGLTPCNANINGAGICDSVVVRRVIDSALGGECVTGAAVPPHSVDLAWTASSSSNVVGYNVYRSSKSGGPYTYVNSSLIVGLGYTDTSIQAGQTYYYVATAVDSNGNESDYSNEAKAVIPSP